MFEKLYKNTDAQPRKGDYVSNDHLLYCGQCNQARECFIEYPTGSGNQIKKPIQCQCDIQAEEEYQRCRKLDASQVRVAALRRLGVTDKAYTHQRFENDDRRNPAVTEKCIQYVMKWDKMQERCFGIIFTGAVGGGKSFFACCIANALIDQGVKVLVTRLSDLVRNRLKDKSADIDLHDYDLVVLDDIGVEGATQTAYNIVDDIYRARIPLIVTTNLSLLQLKETNSIEKQRIYDRILQRASYPIKVDVTVSRLDTARKNARDIQDILNETV